MKDLAPSKHTHTSVLRMAANARSIANEIARKSPLSNYYDDETMYESMNTNLNKMRSTMMESEDFNIAQKT